MLKKSFLALLCSFFSGVTADAHAETPRTIAANSVTLILEDGQVFASGDAEPCRGDNEEGTRDHFKAIPSLDNIVEIDIFADASGNAAAVDKEGSVWVWGKDWHETIDPKDRKPPHIPFRHPNLKDVTSIAMGENHLVALEKSGSVLSVAANDSANAYGAIGNGRLGELTREQIACRLPGISDAVAVEAGTDVTLVLRSDGTVWGCGYKPMLGQPTSLLDLGSTEPQRSGVAIPTRIAGLKSITTLSIGHNYVLALDKRGQVWGWGLNDSAQLGPNVSDTQTIAPRKLQGLRNVAAISAGRDFALAISKSGKVIAQGCNVHGVLGDDGGELEGKQRTVVGLKSVAQVFAGHYNAFARAKDGTLLGWGSNDASVGGFAATKDPLTLGVTKFGVNNKAPKPSATLSTGGVKAIVFMRHNGYYFKSEKLQLNIGDATQLRFAVDESKDEHKQTVEIPAGASPYKIRGTIVTDEGRKHEIKSTGVVAVSNSSFESYFEKLVEQKGLVPAIKEAADSFLAKGVQAPFRLQTFDAWTEKDFETFEGKTNVSLPAAYKKVALEIGFFSLGYQDSAHPFVSLLPPDAKRNLEQYTAKALLTDDSSLPDGAFKDVCFGMQYVEVALPKERAGWKNHFIVGTAGDYFHLLVNTGKDRPLSATWTGLLKHDGDNYVEGDPDGYYNWKERGKDKIDYKFNLTAAASEALGTILRKHGVTPLVATPTKEPVYIEIAWPGEDEPEEGETLECLLQSDGW